MKYTTDAQAPALTARASFVPTRLRGALLLLASLLLAGTAADARQAARKLPAPEKIVAEYLKATGGKKRHAAVRDAVYEWGATSEQGETRARTLLKAPASVRTELRGAGGAGSSSTANQRMAWRGGPDSPVVTLTDAEAHTAKLRAVLAAGRLVDFRKMKVLARTVGVEEVEGEQAYVVEFSTREGGRARASFGVAGKLLLKIADADGRNAHLYGDYRPVEGLLVPHRLTVDEGGRGRVAFALNGARFNTNLPDSAFDPPADASLDIPALLRDLARNQEEVDKRINDYTFTRRVTKREVNDRGEVKKEKVTVQEVYPVQGYGWVMKLVEEDGRPLPPERAAKEERRVAEELAKAEREGPERLREWKEKRERERAKRAEKRRRQGGADAADEDEEVEVGIATFLRASEFVSPRRETLRGRETIVFDFRPRPGFRPSNRGEAIASKLSGVAWVDPVERQVVRLEARLVEGFKIGGGLMASIKPGSAFAFEQTRLPDGVWLPRFSQVNASARVLLFAGININETHEFGDYKRFDAKTDDGKLEAPEKP